MVSFLRETSRGEKENEELGMRNEEWEENEEL
jgi:hypothetical protein